MTDWLTDWVHFQVSPEIRGSDLMEPGARQTDKQTCCCKRNFMGRATTEIKKPFIINSAIKKLWRKKVWYVYAYGVFDFSFRCTVVFMLYFYPETRAEETVETPRSLVWRPILPTKQTYELYRIKKMIGACCSPIYGTYMQWFPEIEAAFYVGHTGTPARILFTSSGRKWIYSRIW